MKNKFSDHISELCSVWWEWMKADNDARNHSIDYKIRKKSALKCEELINKEYIILDKLNNFFKEKYDK